MALPAGGKVTFHPDGGWSFPDGTVFIKHFVMPSATPGAADRKIETRFIVKDQAGTRGFSYAWNAAGSEANLVMAGATFTLSAPDGAGDFTYAIPAASACTTCHLAAVNDGVLGLETRQLRRATRYPDVAGDFDQIAAWKHWGLFDAALPDPSGWPAALPSPDGGDGHAPEARALGWLHTNCAFCHQPGGPAGTAMDLRMATLFAANATCDVAPQRGAMGIANALLVAPGDSATSILYQRIVAASRPPRMPPLGPTRIDPDGAGLVRDWIDGLDTCPTP